MAGAAIRVRLLGLPLHHSAARGSVRAVRPRQGLGLERLDEFAAHYARTLELPAGFLEGYLRGNLEYGMDARHLEGLERFYRLSFEAGLVDRLSPLEFAAPP